jgi:hypothetical protein
MFKKSVFSILLALASIPVILAVQNGTDKKQPKQTTTVKQPIMLDGHAFIEKDGKMVHDVNGCVKCCEHSKFRNY